jgi:hypothetical protein
MCRILKISVTIIISTNNTSSAFILCKYGMSIGNNKSTNTLSTEHVEVGRHATHIAWKVAGSFLGNT